MYVTKGERLPRSPLNEAEAAADKADRENAGPKPKRGRKAGGKNFSRNFLEERSKENETVVDETQSVCPKCGETLARFGEDCYFAVKMTPSRITVIKHIRPKMKCPGCGAIVEEASDAPFGHSPISASFAASVVSGKLDLGVPLDRQARKMSDLGFPATAQLLSNVFLRSADLLKPLWDGVVSALSSTSCGVINAAFDAFAKDCGFEPMLCKAFHPYTKGKAEDLAKLTERLRPYNGEFSSADELSAIVAAFRGDLNAERSQATGREPREMLSEESKYLSAPDRATVMRQHVAKPMMRRVSRESLVAFEGRKYSVMPKYIGKNVEVRADSGRLAILLGAEIISTHEIDERMFNYDKDDYKAIMKSKAFRDVPDEQIEAIAEANLGVYDLIEKGGVWAR